MAHDPVELRANLDDSVANMHATWPKIAAANEIATIAFLSISTGIYGYPIKLAANVAIDSVRTTMAGLSSVYEVTFCCFSPNDLMVYQKYLARA